MRFSRIAKLLAVSTAAVLMAALLVACGGNEAEVANNDATDQTVAEFPTIKVGTLQTDDLLPLWVAQQEGLLEEAGLNVEIQVFQSGPDQRNALIAGEIDAMMTDMSVAALLSNSDTPVRAVTAMQGFPAGIVVGPNSDKTSLTDLAGVPVAVSTGTIIDYLVDAALTEAGVPADEIKKEEIPALPVRLEMLMAGQVEAAGLPWTMVAAAEKQGATVLFDREAAAAYPATVLVFTQSFLDGKPSTGDAVNEATVSETIGALLGAWGQAVDAINADPNSFRGLLVENANLPEALADSYQVANYPAPGLPEQAQWDAVLTWMVSNDLVGEDVVFSDLIYPN